MERHKLATQAQGVAGLKDICNLLSVGIDPTSTFQEYTEVVGSDMNSVPIEAGLPVAAWHWDAMSQEDFNRLLGYGPASVYIRTRKNSGTSGYDFSTYLAVMKRPVAEGREGLLIQNVTVEFVALEWQS